MATMRRLMWIGLGLATLGALLRVEEEDDGGGVVAAPLALALAIEVAVFLLRNSQSRLLGPPRRS
jgi:hypothetical protein